jgi:hypothetical protein
MLWLLIDKIGFVLIDEILLTNEMDLKKKEDYGGF